MHKEEIQVLLDRFGYSVAVRRNIGNTGRVHMIHSGKTFDRIVEYTLDEPKDLIKLVFGYAKNEDLQCFDNVPDFEVWLNTL